MRKSIIKKNFLRICAIGILALFIISNCELVAAWSTKSCSANGGEDHGNNTDDTWFNHIDEASRNAYDELNDYWANHIRDKNFYDDEWYWCYKDGYNVFYFSGHGSIDQIRDEDWIVMDIYDIKAENKDPYWHYVNGPKVWGGYFPGSLIFLGSCDSGKKSCNNWGYTMLNTGAIFYIGWDGEAGLNINKLYTRGFFDAICDGKKTNGKAASKGWDNVHWYDSGDKVPIRYYYWYSNSGNWNGKYEKLRYEKYLDNHIGTTYSSGNVFYTQVENSWKNPDGAFYYLKCESFTGQAKVRIWFNDNYIGLYTIDGTPHTSQDGAEPLILHFNENEIVSGYNKIEVYVQSGSFTIRHSQLVIKAE